MSPREILAKHWRLDFEEYPVISESAALAAMKEFASQERDKALDWAASHGDTILNGGVIVGFGIKPKTILSGKTHKDLEI